MKLQENFILAPEKVDELVAKVREYLQANKVLKTDVNKAALLTDNVLLNWLEQMPVGTEVSIDCFIRFRQPSIVLTCEGKECNPLQDQEDEFSKRLLGNLALFTQFVYSENRNIVAIKLPRLQYSSFTKLLLGAVAGLVVVFLMLQFMDPGSVTVLVDGVFKPALVKMMKLLGTVASFMVFFSIVSGIINMGDISAFSKTGKQIISVYFFFGTVGVILANLLGCLYFRVVNVGSEGFGIGIVKDLFARILEFIPGNLVEPFVTGNNLQIVVMAIATGVVILTLNNRVEPLKRFMESVNTFFQTLLMHFSDMLPFLVFISVVIVGLTSNYQTLKSVFDILATYCVICGIILVLFCWWTVRRCSFDWRHYLPAIFAPWFNGFVTTSSSATLPIMQETLVTKFGMDRKFSDLILSFGLIIGHLGDGITFSVVTLGVASIFDISISISQLMILVICEIVFSFSVPPVSGGALALLLMLMHQISAPAECTVVCVALVFFVDFMGTSTTVVNIMNGVLLCRNKMSDKERRGV